MASTTKDEGRRHATVELGLPDALRMSTVTRWHIVHTTRHQSVADHSACVALIAMHAARRMGLSDDVVREVAFRALLHDLPEVLMGDLVPPTKAYLGVGGAIRQLEGRMAFAGERLGDHHFYSTTVTDIVHLADMVEAAAFLARDGVPSAHMRLVADKIHKKIADGWGEFGTGVLADALADRVTSMDTLLEAKEREDA